MPILGSCFLRHHHLLVDVAGSCLSDASTLEPIPAASSLGKPGKHSELYAASTKEEFRDLLAEYPDVISSVGFSAADTKYPVHHSVPTTPGPPVFAKARRLDAEKLESAVKEFAAMEANQFNIFKMRNKNLIVIIGANLRFSGSVGYRSFPIGCIYLLNIIYLILQLLHKIAICEFSYKFDFLYLFLETGTSDRCFICILRYVS